MLNIREAVSQENTEEDLYNMYDVQLHKKGGKSLGLSIVRRKYVLYKANCLYVYMTTYTV